MIEKHLAKLQAAKPKPGDVVPFDQRGGLALGRVSLGDDVRVNEDHHYADNAVFKRTGSPTLGLANDFRGMPQLGMELRGYGETVIDLTAAGVTSGSITLDVMDGQIYVIEPTADVTFEFHVADFEDLYGRTGTDLSFSLLIENNNTKAVNLTVDHWGPTGTAPNLSRKGYFEVSIAICKLPTRQIVRAWPSIQKVIP